MHILTPTARDIATAIEFGVNPKGKNRKQLLEAIRVAKLLRGKPKPRTTD